VEQLADIRDNLKTKGVNMRRLNPKGMKMDEFFGCHDKDSNEWMMGLFT
jgi:hypothetical protein